MKESVEKYLDERGELYVIEEFSKIFPFDIRRVYWIIGAETKSMRGSHAHKKLNQLFVLVQGTCELIINDSKSETRVILSSKGEAYFVQAGMWRDLVVTRETIIFILADAKYDENDYIRNFEDFVNWRLNSSSQ